MFRSTIKFLNIFSRKKIKREILKICRTKILNARENLGKSGRENYFTPVKKTKKVLMKEKVAVKQPKNPKQNASENQKMPIHFSKNSYRET